jgi:hypothetical protein
MRSATSSRKSHSRSSPQRHKHYASAVSAAYDQIRAGKTTVLPAPSHVLCVIKNFRLPPLGGEGWGGGQRATTAMNPRFSIPR